MKQIKVPLTPREWAEKRLQVIVKYHHLWKEDVSDHTIANCDRIINCCGFYLVEEAMEEKEAIQKANELFKKRTSLKHYTAHVDDVTYVPKF